MASSWWNSTFQRWVRHWKWRFHRRKHWRCWKRFNPVGQLPQRLSCWPGFVFLLLELVICILSFVFFIVLVFCHCPCFFSWYFSRVNPVRQLSQLLSCQPGAILYSCCLCLCLWNSLWKYFSFFEIRPWDQAWPQSFLNFFNFLIGQDKTYEISVAAGKTIKMTFAAFSLEAHNRCGWDYLKVFRCSEFNQEVQLSGDISIFVFQISTMKLNYMAIFEPFSFRFQSRSRILHQLFSIATIDICSIFNDQIEDGNGSTLLDKSCGSVKPATITSKTNK